MAKSIAHGLRALSLWVAVAPVLAIPFLLGGVSWQEAMLSIAINSSAMCWALAAGVLGSAWSKTWGRAILRAAIFALFFLLILAFATGEGLSSGLRAGRGSFWGSPMSAFFDVEPSKWDYLFLVGFGFHHQYLPRIRGLRFSDRNQRPVNLARYSHIRAFHYWAF